MRPKRFPPLPPPASEHEDPYFRAIDELAAVVLKLQLQVSLLKRQVEKRQGGKGKGRKA